jgi:mannose-6-phosphate isomerase-like protein (cupin superfamily)
MHLNYYKNIENHVKSFGFEIISKDFHRPWGGFLVIKENQAQKFSDKFFNGIEISNLKISDKLSPKILIVKPKARLSWQYHLRRAEIWQVYRGCVGVVTSDNDIETKMKILKEGDQITLNKGERHRLIGLDKYAIISEIWQHTDLKSPSDEKDIIRLQDDFGR